MKNKHHNIHSFGSGQGNNLHYPYGTRFLAMGLSLLAIILIFVFKSKLAQRTKNKKTYIFKSTDIYYQVIGIAFLIGTAVRIGTLVFYDYPLKGEILNLHLCRFHFVILFFFMAIRKKHGIKYITYLTVFGGFMGLFYLNLESPYINQVGTPPNYTPEQGGVLHPDHLMTNMETLAHDEGFRFYHDGIDSMNYGDSIFTHVIIIVVPVYMGTAYSGKLSTKEFHYSQLAYVSATFGFGIFNGTSTLFTDDSRGGSNFGYLGVDKANDYKTSLGTMSHGPWNLVMALMGGTSMTFLGHYIWMYQNKFVFFEKDKKFEYRKSEHGTEYINGYKNGTGGRSKK